MLSRTSPDRTSIAPRTVSRFNGIIACLVVLYAVSTPAAAVFIIGVWSATDYIVRVDGVPDLDQRRLGLPNNGNMHCVPTSAVNWLGYFSNHGGDFLLTGGATPLWQWASSNSPYYEQNTLLILDMGLSMETNGVTGTAGDKANAGLKQWFQWPHFMIHSKHTTPSSHVRYDHMAKWLRSGVPVMASVGWYNEIGGSDLPLLVRKGGHAMSMSFASRLDDNRWIGWRDPATDDGSLTTQSTFRTDIYSIEPRIVNRRFNFTNGTSDDVMIVVDRVTGFGSGHLDGYRAIQPAFALTTPPGSSFGPPVLRRFQPFSFSYQSQETQRDTPLAGYFAPLLDVMADSQSHHNYLIIAPKAGFGTSTPIVRYDPTTNETATLFSVSNGRRLAFSGCGSWMYLIDQAGLRIRRYDTSTETPSLTSEVNPPAAVSAITYDDVNRKVVVLSTSLNRLFRFDPHLPVANHPEVFLLPPHITLSGDGSVTINPLDNGIWFTSTGSNAIYRLVPESPIGNYTFTITVAQNLVSEPRGLSAADNGDLFFQSNGVIRQFRITGDFPNYQAHQVFDSPFAGLPAGNVFHLPRSRTNFDPTIHTTNDYINILPTETIPGEPDCFADLNMDGVVGVPDLLILLGNWGTCYSCAGDLTGNGNIGVSDLLALLAAWGPCPR